LAKEIGEMKHMKKRYVDKNGIHRNEVTKEIEGEKNPYFK